MATIQSFEHGKTPVVTAVLGVLATLGFWFRWAAEGGVVKRLVFGGELEV